MGFILLKKSVLNFKMFAVVVLSFAVLFSSFIIVGYIHNPFQLQTGLDLLSVYTIPFASSSFVVFAGLFPGIPYAYSYIEERNCGYLKLIQYRISRKKYAIQKIFFTGLSGGMSMLLPGILIFILIDIMSLDVTASNYPDIFTQLMWAPYMFLWGGRFIFFLKGILLFLFGVMWSELSLMISLLSKNKYVAFIAPFLIYEMAWILIPIHILNPVFLVRADFGIETPIYIPYLIDIIYILILISINYILFIKGEKR